MITQKKGLSPKRKEKKEEREQRRAISLFSG